MKKTKTFFHVLVTCLIISATLVACSDNQTKLSAGTIVDRYNSLMADNAQIDHFVNLSVGHYEVSDTERLLLKKLEAADLITYSDQRYAWWEKEMVTKRRKVSEYRYSLWYGWYEDYHYETSRAPEYRFCEHVFADVALTPKGKKLVVAKEDIPQAIEKEDQDLVQPKIDESVSWPEDEVDCSWPYAIVPNPFLNQETKETEEIIQPTSTKTDKTSRPKQHTHSSSSTVNTSNDSAIERIESSQYETYATETENKENITLRAYTTQACKARHIRISKENGITTATGEVLIEIRDVTAAGRIINAAEEGRKEIMDVTLIYYLDKGWVLQ